MTASAGMFQAGITLHVFNFCFKSSSEEHSSLYVADGLHTELYELLFLLLLLR